MQTVKHHYVKRTIVASGRDVLTITYNDTPNKFYVLMTRGGISGPFDINDNRFKKVTENV